MEGRARAAPMRMSEPERGTHVADAGQTMRSGCPVNAAAEALGDAWSLVILRDLMLGRPLRFSELAGNSLEGIPRGILAARLRRLEAGGLVTRTRVAGSRGEHYALTDAGIDVLPILVQLGNWGIKHRPTSPLLRVRTEVLARGGAPFVAAMMAELREAYLGVPRPDPTEPRPIGRIAEAYLDASMRLADEPGLIDRAADAAPEGTGAPGARYLVVPYALPAEPALAEVAEWAIAHLSSGIGVRDLAAAAHLSERQLRRRFIAVYGRSPGDWLTGERVRIARHLLTSTGLPVDEIASRVGFATTAGLRTAFTRAGLMSPRAYRRAAESEMTADRS